MVYWHHWTNIVPVCRFLGDCVKTHPPEHRVKLNRGGFPLRPGKGTCTSYLKAAFCPLMKACMLHHPNLRIELRAGGDGGAEAAAAGDEDVLGAGAKRKKSKTFENDKLEVVEDGDWTADYPQNPAAHRCEQFMKYGACECATTPIRSPIPPPPPHPSTCMGACVWARGDGGACVTDRTAGIAMHSCSWQHRGVFAYYIRMRRGQCLRCVSRCVS